MAYDRAEWSRHYDDDRGFRPLRDSERDLLARHAPAPDSGRALELGCGTGELAVFLAELGYTVDAVDFAEGALARARKERTGTERVRWLCLDIERDDPAELSEDGYDLITLRLVFPFLHDRTRILHSLAGRLRAGGTLVVITPVAATTPKERRHIALNEEEISLLAEGWAQVERFEAEGLAVLVLRSPAGDCAVVEKSRPEPQAVVGVCAVVTDDCGRVLLGRSTRGMWELPGGRVEPGESFQAAGVRELAEETDLTADLGDAHLLTILHDDRADVRRLSAVVRVSAWDGTLALPEPHSFRRWEWHDLHALAGLGSVFAPSAQALEAVWPGVLPGLPPVHAYPHAIPHPAIGGEPAEAVRLRQEMAERVIAGGWAPSPVVQDALRTVPRHRFIPESPLRTAYDDDLAVVTSRDGTGTAISSVSAAWLQSDMIEKLHLEPGMTVFEAGSGGYNAELMAHVGGATGRVVTVDLDPYVVHRTHRITAEAGRGQVTVLLGDGSQGAPEHTPRGGFDGSMITHSCWDIAPAWREQLAEGRYLVLPLEIHGYTRAIALQRHGDVLHARDWTYCEFVRDRGAAARTTPITGLAGGEFQLCQEDGTPPDPAGLEEALRGPRHELPTGVTVAGMESFETLQLYAATTLPGFCRMAGARDSALAALPYGADTATTVADGSLAYLTHILVKDGETPEERRSEFIIHAVGPARDELAERMAACVQSWDQHVRGNGYPQMTVHPTGTPDHELPTGHVLDKTSSRLVFQWPGQHPAAQITVEEAVLAEAGGSR
ncbi:methyltransferase, FxLD system [Streptomyces sp. bgisy130]|uniref:methyltransferase, FxLD system n=1 Tax=Streptomyces sp. bgisy130 TaxID=3413788 RepID=UPI003F49DA00